MLFVSGCHFYSRLRGGKGIYSSTCLFDRSQHVDVSHVSNLLDLVKLSLSTLWRHIGGSRGIAPIILNLDSRGWWMVNLTPRPFYLGKGTRYPLNRGLGESEPAWVFCMKNDRLPLSEFEPWIVQPISYATPTPSPTLVTSRNACWLRHCNV